MMLQTNRLLLRRYTMDDLDFYAVLWADEAVVKFIGEGVTRGHVEAEERLARLITGYDTGYGLLAMWHKEAERLVGHAGLVVQEVDGVREIELGYWLAHEFWGQGLATEAALALREEAFEARGFRRLISLIQPGNVASMAVARRVGMEKEKTVVFRGREVNVFHMEASVG